MRQNHISLPSIDAKRFFVTQPAQKRFNKYSRPCPLKESKDKTQIFSRYMDSSIIKKKTDFSIGIETERKVDLYDEEQRSILVPKECADRNLRGTKAVFKFYQHYKRLDKIIDETKAASVPQSPYTAMLEMSQQIMAFPSTIGLVKAKGRGNSIQIPNYYIGDHKSEIISAALSQVKDVKQLILSKNRLTDKGVEHIMDKITNDLTRLDLSNNKISTIHPSLLKILGTGACQLSYLNLENNKLSDESINTMSMVLSLNRSVKYLNLGRNFLTKNCVEALTLIIQSSKCMQQLYIHWNKINGIAAKPIFQKLQSNSNLLLLDYSHNVISQGAPSVAGAISQMLLKNKSLLHVDLSFNNFTLNESTEIANGLKKNRTIYGFHFLGNYGYVDAKGFLKFDETQESISAENGHVKIQSFDIVHKRPRIRLTVQKMKDVCWICEGWSPQEIISHIDDTKDKFAEIYLNYEAYRPKVVHVEDGWFKLHEMFPPEQIRFYCSNKENTEFILNDFDVRQERFDIGDGNETVKKMIKKVNVILKKPKSVIVDGKAKTKVLPRTPDVVRKEPKRRWKYSDSIWAKEWKKQDQDMTKKCFERDWGHSKISNIVKNPEEQQKLKAFLLQNYKNIKEIYKYFSSFSPFDGIWAVSANSFTEFCNQSKIISKQLPLKIVDLTFITTNSMSGADWRTSFMVPERGLVRFQFLQSIVRLADQKYKKSGLVQTVLEAVTSLTNNHLASIYKKHQSEHWRESVYFVEEVDILLKKYRPVFANIYRKNSKLKVKPGEKPFMCLQEFKSLCQRSGMLLGSIGERNIFINFNSSFMTQVDEVESERIVKLSEIEMIEAFARMANDVGFCNLTPDISELEKQSRPFYKKFQEMIYVLIQTVCGDDIKNLFPVPSISIFQYNKDDEDSDS